MRQTAADCPAVPDLVVGDVFERRREQRAGVWDAGIVLQHAPSDARPQSEGAVVRLDTVEPRNAGEIDQQPRGRDSLNAIIGNRLCPPARGRASSFAASKAIASWRDVGAQ